MAETFITRSPSQTRRVGAVVALELLRTNPGKKALVLLLKGELGSGKTTFTQGFAKALGIRHRITSPTFLLARPYPVKGGRIFYHIDCYRIRSGRDLIALGFRDWIAHPDHIIVIEWAEKIQRLVPKRAIQINFSHGKKRNERIISISV
jgi:tRNA threonylcarbamoyladenosine biosynthesis protein TsaE